MTDMTLNLGVTIDVPAGPIQLIVTAEISGIFGLGASTSGELLAELLADAPTTATVDLFDVTVGTLGPTQLAELLAAAQSATISTSGLPGLGSGEGPAAPSVNGADTSPKQTAPTSTPTAAEPEQAPAAGAPVPPAHGSVALTILTAVADLGGTFEGGVAQLGHHVHPQSPEFAATETRRLATEGLLSLNRISPRKVIDVRLTGAGWAAIDRQPARHPAASGAGAHFSDHRPDAPAPVEPIDLDAGPIARRPFDPDAARRAAAGAL